MMIVDARIDYEGLVEEISSCLRINRRQSNVHIHMNFEVSLLGMLRNGSEVKRIKYQRGVHLIEEMRWMTYQSKALSWMEEMMLGKVQVMFIMSGLSVG